ncbi:MAG: M50 family metallopeptidase [Gammaproteobacteria bacterium]|nr:M50 family metallopeptidase [Gammaproteobacteria bacterium]MDH5652157.1 M50 family metallopeptidase [Gammaproteobacteria bacterium]
MDSQKRLLVYIISALVISAVPFLSWPFNWIETYFHEISHGLTAVFTGGHIREIVIRIDGSGYCEYAGGWHGLTSFAGYAGAILSGALMYLSARSLGRSSTIISTLLVIAILLTIIFYAGDLITMLILGILVLLFYLAAAKRFSQVFNRVEEFIGIYVLMNAIRSPFHLLDGQSIGDGAALAKLTYIPEIVWVAVWVVLGLAVLIGLWRSENRQRRMFR